MCGVTNGGGVLSLDGEPRVFEESRRVTSEDVEDLSHHVGVAGAVFEQRFPVDRFHVRSRQPRDVLRNRVSPDGYVFGSAATCARNSEPFFGSLMNTHDAMPCRCACDSPSRYGLPCLRL